MFNWLKRLFNIGKAEANTLLDRFEDPVKMTEQGIKNLKQDLTTSLQSLAHVKANKLQVGRDHQTALKESKGYENKAIELLRRGQTGDLNQAESERLATLALERKKQADDRKTAAQKNLSYLEQSLPKMETNVAKLKQEITKWENELVSLKARSRVSKATTKLNKQLAGISSSNTLGNLEKMKEKVIQQEALAESYEDINNQDKSVDDEINLALGHSTTTNDALEQLKAKINIPTNSQNNQKISTSSPGNSKPFSELDKLKQKLNN